MSNLRLTRLIFFFYFWWSLLTPNFINIFNAPFFIGVLDEVLQIILYGAWALILINSNEAIEINKRVKFIAIGFILVVFASFLFNRSSVGSLLQFSVIYLRPISIALISATIFSFKDIRMLLKHLLILLVIQFILNITWTLGINPIPHYKFFIDINTGTFESVAPIAYMCVFILYYLVATLSLKSKHKNKTNIFILIFAVLVQLFFTFTTHAILLGVVSLAGLVLVNKTYIKYVGATIAFIALVIVSLGSFEKDNFHMTTAELLSPDNLANDRAERLQKSIKFASLYLVVSGNIPEIKSPLLGAGPGMYGSLVAARGSKLYKKYNDTEKLRDAGIKVSDTTSVTGEPYSGYLAIIGDIGWFGFSIYIYFYCYIIISVLRFVRTNKHKMTSHPAVFIGLIPALFFYMILDLIYDLGAFKIMSIGFWIWVGLAMKEIYKHENLGTTLYRLVKLTNDERS